MARPANSVRRLKPVDRRKLEMLFRHPPNARVKGRALVIRLSGRGYSPTRIVKVVGRSRSSTWRWIKDFNERGVNALFISKSRGAARRGVPP